MMISLRSLAPTLLVLCLAAAGCGADETTAPVTPAERKRADVQKRTESLGHRLGVESLQIGAYSFAIDRHDSGDQFAALPVKLTEGLCAAKGMLKAQTVGLSPYYPHYTTSGGGGDLQVEITCRPVASDAERQLVDQARDADVDALLAALQPNR